MKIYNKVLHLTFGLSPKAGELEYYKFKIVKEIQSVSKVSNDIRSAGETVGFFCLPRVGLP